MPSKKVHMEGNCPYHILPPSKVGIKVEGKCFRFQNPIKPYPKKTKKPTFCLLGTICWLPSHTKLALGVLLLLSRKEQGMITWPPPQSAIMPLHSATMPISHHTYNPLYLAAIWSVFATFKPCGLFDQYGLF